MALIYISSATGLTPILQLYVGATAFGSSFTATEIGTTGEYFATMPTAPYGKYLVIATSSNNVKIASGEIMWDGNYELVEGIATLQGLNSNVPVVNTASSRVAGNINLQVSGYGTSTTTVQRV